MQIRQPIHLKTRPREDQPRKSLADSPSLEQRIAAKQLFISQNSLVKDKLNGIKKLDEIRLLEKKIIPSLTKKLKMAYLYDTHPSKPYLQVNDIPALTTWASGKYSSEKAKKIARKLDDSKLKLAQLKKDKLQLKQLQKDYEDFIKAKENQIKILNQTFSPKMGSITRHKTFKPSSHATVSFFAQPAAIDTPALAKTLLKRTSGILKR